MKKNQEKEHQHVLSAVLLKQFQKDKSQIIEDVKVLGTRFVYDIPSSNSYPSMAFYRIMKTDFKKDFIIYRSNVIGHKTRNNKICYPYIYNIDLEQHKLFTDKFGIFDTRDDYTIEYLIENGFSILENKIGLFYKYIRNKYISKKKFYKYEEDIISFVSSNELRGIHLYNRIKQDYNLNFKDIYAKFEKYYFFTFLENHDNYLFDKLDNYEQVEVSNYLQSLGIMPLTNDYSLYLNKILTKISIDNYKNKNYMIVNNISNLKYLLSDIATSIFYSNNPCFNEILNILKINNLKERPTKITLMPISPDILIVLSDVPFKSGFLRVKDFRVIKKINSIIFSTNNEWLVVYDVTKNRNEILNESFLLKLQKHARCSNALHWFKHGFDSSLESYSFDRFSYKKPSVYMCNIFKILKKINNTYMLSIPLFNNTTFYLDFDILSSNIVFNQYNKYDNSIGYIFGKNSFMLYIYNKEIYSFMSKLTKSEFNTFKVIILKEHILTDIYIDFKKECVVCHKFGFFEKAETLLQHTFKQIYFKF